ncbi:unnamed protein product [Malus baccata var. baccata]
MKLRQTLSVLKACQNQNVNLSQILTRTAPTTLLGPPEIRLSTPLRPPPQPQPPSSGDPFTDLMVANFNHTTIQPTQPRPPMGLTENNSPTFLSSGNPCLDFFFHVVPDTPASYVNEQLPLAWSHNALTTLKLICNLRGVRGTGKSDKEGFYKAAFWLHQNHPKTLACNAKSVAQIGFFKDLPEILYRLVEGQEVRENQKAEWLQKKTISKRSSHNYECDDTGPKQGKRGEAGKKRAGMEPTEVRVMKDLERGKLEKAKTSALRRERFIAQTKKAFERYQSDPDYRFLHERVSDVFAKCLNYDIANLRSSKKSPHFTLAAKWCPSLDSPYDRTTLLCESIARKVFPKELYTEYQTIEDEHYAYRVRDRLRKEVLVPLRKALQLPEVYMSSNQWSSLPYNRVASVAMTLYKEIFLLHDKVRFEKYLEDVEAGTSKIAAGALLPHQIIHSLEEGDLGGKVAELQWKRMVDDMLEHGKMRNCMAVCDVSSSMSGTPMDVSVALGLLVSELSEEPWKGKVITFSERPQLHLIQGDDLRSKCGFVRNMDWGMNTNFQKVFDLLLEVAVNGNLRPEHMIKRIFVFSDMEFDMASRHYSMSSPHYKWETDYEAIQRKFKEKGYGDVVPQIVFWNLRHSSSTAVLETEPGVALVSGFSKNMLKLFIDNDGEIRPDHVMEAAISGREYRSLVVVD